MTIDVEMIDGENAALIHAALGVEGCYRLFSTCLCGLATLRFTPSFSIRVSRLTYQVHFALATWFCFSAFTYYVTYQALFSGGRCP
ncbi:unnamed protein product [Calypogeia fissa]